MLNWINIIPYFNLWFVLRCDIDCYKPNRLIYLGDSKVLQYSSNVRHNSAVSMILMRLWMLWTTLAWEMPILPDVPLGQVLRGILGRILPALRRSVAEKGGKVHETLGYFLKGKTYSFLFVIEINCFWHQSCIFSDTPCIKLTFKTCPKADKCRLCDPFGFTPRGCDTAYRYTRLVPGDCPPRQYLLSRVELMDCQLMYPNWGMLTGRRFFRLAAHA